MERAPFHEFGALEKRLVRPGNACETHALARCRGAASRGYHAAGRQPGRTTLARANPGREQATAADAGRGVELFDLHAVSVCLAASLPVSRGERPRDLVWRRRAPDRRR